MSIIGVKFAVLVVAALLAYFILPKRFQWIVILFANIGFYFFAGVKYFAYIIVSSVVAWAVALKVDKVAETGAAQAKAAGSSEEKKAIRKQFNKKKKNICAIAVVLPLGIWGIIKYGNFIITNLNSLIKLFSANAQIPALSLVLPLGMSFYSFHIVGYVIDIYRRKYPVERNFFRFFTFVTYFPHITEGPFSRYDDLGKTLFAEHSFSYDRLCQGISRIIWGLYKKLLIADILDPYVTGVFTNCYAYTGTHILLATFGFAVQIYADFSGYMDIVCGISHIFGIELAENFRQPFFAKSVEEYWRRWHITIGTWFKDYVFMPMSMSSFAQKMGRSARAKLGARTGRLIPGYFALIFVWGATGLWHGASWEFVVWGYLNLFIIVLSMQLEGVYGKVKTALRVNSGSWAYKAFMVVRTFLIISFLRLFTTGFSLGAEAAAIGRIFTAFKFGEFMGSASASVGAAPENWILIILGTVVMIIVDSLNESGRWEAAKEKCPVVLKALIYAVMIMALLMFADSGGGGFIYAEF